jgi:hypothetical protein
MPIVQTSSAVHAVAASSEPVPGRGHHAHTTGITQTVSPTWEFLLWYCPKQVPAPGRVLQEHFIRFALSPTTQNVDSAIQVCLLHGLVLMKPSSFNPIKNNVLGQQAYIRKGQTFTIPSTRLPLSCSYTSTSLSFPCQIAYSVQYIVRYLTRKTCTPLSFHVHYVLKR